MASVHSKIYEKYGIDINKVNIIKLYKIDNANISSTDLEMKICECRKRWEQTINGANEKFAERDRKHLEKADVYESILKDDRLRKELFEYYNNGNKKNSNINGSNLEFAREYFSVIRSTKKIRKSDVEFFFEYYPEQRKDKKAILTMLSKEMKIVGLGKESSYADEKLEEDENKEKYNSSIIIENLFRKETILKIRKCEGYFEKAQKSEDVKKRYPELMDSMYEFLCVDDAGDIETFRKIVSEKREKVFNDKQEYGSEYASLVDMVNKMEDVIKNKDVIDNFSEFKLLVKYPELSPYMYEIGDMKPDTLRKIFEVANDAYRFRDINDFILSYFEPIYDNFNIRISEVNGMMKKAKAKAGQNRILKEVDKKLGRDKKKKYPIGVEIVHWLLYWPLTIMYFIFEVFKCFFALMEKSFIPVLIVTLVIYNYILAKSDAGYCITDLIYIFDHNKWHEYIFEYNEKYNLTGHFFVSLFFSIAAITKNAIICVLPAFLVGDMFYECANTMNKQMDWIGIKRTYKFILDTLKQKTYSKYDSLGKDFYKSSLTKIFINVISVVALVVVIVIVIQLYDPPHYVNIYKDGYTPPR